MNEEIKNALPSYDKEAIKDPVEFFRSLFRMCEMSKESAIPCVVTEYDSKTGLVTVLPLAKYAFDTMDGEVSADRETVKVRAFSIRHGGYAISAPIYKGDTGWLIAGDRFCDSAIKKNSEQPEKDLTDDELKDRSEVPNDCSLFKFANGFFLPFSFASPIRNADGSLVIRKFRKDDVKDEDFTEIKIGESGIIVRDRKYKITTSEKSIAVESGEEKLILDERGLSFDGKIDKTIKVVTDIRYNSSNHRIEKKTTPMDQRGSFIVNVGEESEWMMIDGGQAVPVSVE